MSQSPTQLKPASRRRIEVAKMFAYFVLLFVALRILREIFKEISTTTYFAELSRLSGLAASAFETSKNTDDIIITLITLTLTLVLVLPVAWVHVITNTNKDGESLTQTLITLSIIVAGVMLLLQDNLARSFSLVGVVGAVRYRNTLKDPKDAVFVFLAIGIGMACGLQAVRVAVMLSVFECLILIVLWVYHTGRPAVADQKLIEMLKEHEGKGHRTPAQALAWLSPEARARLDAELETQSRYIQLAERVVRRKGEKKPNAVIVVEMEPGSSRAHLNKDLEDHRGNWRLLGIEEKNGVTMLEYLGRVPRKKTPPLRFLERLRKTNVGVRHIAFHSLRKMIAENTDVYAEEPEEDDSVEAEPSMPSEPSPAKTNHVHEPLAASQPTLEKRKE